MAGQASIKNGKKGGRPKGSLNRATIEKKEAEQQFTDRVVKSVNRLFNAQISIAEGCSYLYRVDETGEGSKKRKEHILVTNEEEIKQYLDGEAEGEYYYITTKTPDNKAIDSLMDRAFGKARQSIGLDGGLDPDNNPIPILSKMNVSTHQRNSQNSATTEANTGNSRGNVSQ